MERAVAHSGAVAIALGSVLGTVAAILCSDRPRYLGRAEPLCGTGGLTTAFVMTIGGASTAADTGFELNRL